MSIVTFGLAAVYSSAMSCQSDLPGSLFLMCYQLIVTGSPPRGRGARMRRRRRGAATMAPASRAAAAGGDRRGREKDRDPRTGSHWPSLLVAGRACHAPVGDDRLLHRDARSGRPTCSIRPAREEESGGRIGAQPDRWPLVGRAAGRAAPPRKLRAASDTFGQVTLMFAAIGDCQSCFQIRSDSCAGGWSETFVDRATLRA